MRTSAVVTASLLALIAQAKELRLPNTCQGPVCLANVVWKKGVGRGFTPHTLTGSITTTKAIQSITLTLQFHDNKRNGIVDLVLNNITDSQPFEFRVSSNYDGIEWDHSSLYLTAWAIHSIAPVSEEGISCRFEPRDRRLKLVVENRSTEDLILDYSLLTMTAGAENHKLNGTGGRYIEFDKPKANALIPAGTILSDELVPIEAVKLINNQWNESTLLNLLLTMPDVTLRIPLSKNGTVQIVRVPLNVDKTTLSVEANVEGRRK